MKSAILFATALALTPNSHACDDDWLDPNPATSSHEDVLQDAPTDTYTSASSVTITVINPQDQEVEGGEEEVILMEFTVEAPTEDVNVDDFLFLVEMIDENGDPIADRENFVEYVTLDDGQNIVAAAANTDVAYVHEAFVVPAGTVKRFRLGGDISSNVYKRVEVQVCIDLSDPGKDWSVESRQTGNQLETLPNIVQCSGVTLVTP